MNRNFHRVIFNAARGLRMVVQETARGSGKAGGGRTSARGLASAFLAVVASLTAIAASAQIVADPNAPGRQRPTVLVAPNGVPVVNVQSPSAAGVSRNTYRQFDVGAQGVILNNSRTAAQSQLGGMVSGNPWLATGPARVILNEVNSSNPSYLNGAVEIAGQRAEFVLANPSGISVNGATFINSSAVTLTTGTPQFGATGNLENYLVRSGRIGVTGSGLDARDADSIAILSRAFELSGALHAKDLKVIAGANQVSADLSGITTITGSDGKPTYAIDVANLGGMYSNHIFLIVNELGALDNTHGAIEASGLVSTLTLQAATIDNTDGRIANAGSGATTLTATTITNATNATPAAADTPRTGLIAGNGTLAIHSTTLDNQPHGTIASGAGMTLDVSGQLTNRGSIASGSTLDFVNPHAVLDNTAGNLTAAGDIRIDTRSVRNDAGRIATTQDSGADLHLTAATLSSTGGTLASDRDLILTLAGDHTNDTAAEEDGVVGVGADDDALDAVAVGREVGAALQDVGGVDVVDLVGRVVGRVDVVPMAVAVGVVPPAGHGHVVGLIERPDLLDGHAGAFVAQRSGGDLDVGAGLDVGGGVDDRAGGMGEVAVGIAHVVGGDADVACAVDGGAVAVGQAVREPEGGGAGGTDQGLRAAVVERARGDGDIAAGDGAGVGVDDGVGREADAVGVDLAGVDEAGCAGVQGAHGLEGASGGVGELAADVHREVAAGVDEGAGYDGAYGHRERLAATDGTMVLYALGRQDGVANPDQVPGLDSNVAKGVWQAEEVVSTWDGPAPAFDPAYGSCTTACVRFYTQPGYDDPGSTIIRDTQLARGPSTALSEIERIAHTVAVDDRLAPGAGAAGRIVAGGDIRIDFARSLTNSYSDIMAGGRADLIGAAGAAAVNEATTLYRRYHFDGTRVYADGVTAAYTMPDQSVVIGSIQGTLSGAQGVTIKGGSVRNVDTSAGSAANIVERVQLASGGTPAAIPQGSQGGQGGANTILASNGQAVSLPQGGLFRQQPGAASRYLYETRAEFTSYRAWLSSDYLLRNLGLDPNTTQKRLGDGFYEQRLINEQVAQLTGRRYLAGYTDDDAQYLALLQAGVSVAEQYGLRPGIALSAAQMAALTSDIVWLETQTVTLADGSTQAVLVPRLYLAQLGANTLRPDGALITGDDVRIEGDSVVNRGGTLGDGATKRLVVIASGDILNQGGTLQGLDIGLKAGGNIRNETLAVTSGWAEGSDRASVQGSHTSLSNVATIKAGRDLSIDAKGDITDVAGRIGAGRDAAIRATGDVRFETLTTGSSSHMEVGTASVDRATAQANTGRIDVGRDLVITAERDLILTGTQATAGGNANLRAGRHLRLDEAESAQASDQRNDAEGSGYRQTRSQTTVQGTGIVAGGNLSTVAGIKANGDKGDEKGDLTVTGGRLEAKGDTTLSASGDVLLDAAREARSSDDYTRDIHQGGLKNTTTTDHRRTISDTAVGSSVSGRNVSISAGRDVAIVGSSVYANDALNVRAVRDVIVASDHDTATDTNFHQVVKTPSGIAQGLALGGLALTDGTGTPDPAAMNLLTRKNSAGEGNHTITTVVGSTLSGGSINVHSGRDTTITGSTLIADKDVWIDADNHLTITSAQSIETSSSGATSHSSGNTGSFLRPAVGRASSSDQTQDSRTTQVGSTVASLGGNVRLSAGGTYTQTASDVLALGTGADGKSGHIDITARNVVIDEAYDTRTAAQQAEAKSLTVGGTASVPLYDAARGTASTARATGQTGDSRIQALGAATTAYNAYQTYESAQNPDGYKVGAMLTDSHSQSSSTQSSRNVVGSQVVGAGDVHITATGGGRDSNLTATAATISGNNVTLRADNAVTLQSARSTSDYTYEQDGSSHGLGVSYSAGAQNGMTIDVAAGSRGGTGSSHDSTNVNTHVRATNTASIRSGGDTTLDGAVVTAHTVKVDVSGNLIIRSEQDTRTGTADEHGSGFDASICYFWCYGTPVVAGGSTNRASGNGRYASVTEQSGIQAGDGGFDVKVAGNTDLTGGVIASTDAAVDGGKNRFETGSLTTSDIVNVDTFSAEGFSVSGSYGATASRGSGVNGASVGIGQVSGARTSVTVSGISGVDGSGNSAVRAGDGANGLTPAWRLEQLMAEVHAQVSITSTASGIVVQLAPQLAAALTQLITSGSTATTLAPTQIDRANREFDRLLGDPSLTDTQRAELAGLKNFFAALVSYGNATLGGSGGADRVVDGTSVDTTPAQFLVPGAAGSGGAAGAGIAGQGGTRQDQGYRDPESGQWIGGSPPLTLPSLSSLEQLALTNPVLGPVYRAYVALSQSTQNQSNGNSESGTGPAGGNQADTYGTPPNGASPPPGDDDSKYREADFNFDGVERHSGARLRGDGISTSEAVTAVREDIRRMIAEGNLRLSNSGPTSYRITIRGVEIEYRLFNLPDGRVNVGTIFPVK